MQIPQINHSRKNTNSLLLILRCVTHTLTDDSHFRQRSTLLVTPRCVPHILTGNVQSITTQCLRQKQNIAKLVANCKLNPHPTANACTTLHKTAKQITVVSTRMKPIGHVMQQKWKPMQSSWQLTGNYSNWVPQVQVLSSPKSSKTLKSQDISKTVIPLQSQLDSSFITAFAFLLAAVGGLQA